MWIVGEKPEMKGFGRAGGEVKVEENWRGVDRSRGQLA
jgi:hypothetical protein